MLTPVETMQIVVLLPMVNTYFSHDMMAYFRGIRHILLRLEILHIHELFFKNYDYDQRDTILNLLGFESTSGFINLINMLSIFLLIGIISLTASGVFYYYNGRLATKDDEPSKTFATLFLDWMRSGPLIKTMNIVFLLFMTAAVSEISKYGKSYIKTWSIAFSGILMFLCLAYLTFVILCTFLPQKLLERYNLIALKETLQWSKPNITSRIYSIVSIARKCVVVMLTVIDYGADPVIILSILLGLQTCYFSYLVIVRHFKHLTLKREKFKTPMFKMLDTIVVVSSCVTLNNLLNE